MTTSDNDVHERAKTGPLFVVIAGMHRSGTSALAGLLQQMGARLGTDLELMPPKPDNPVGFFERLDVFDLHQSALQSLGAEWDVVSKLLEPVERRRRLEELEPSLRVEMDEVVAGLSGDGIAVLKDPRFSLLLPLWSRVLDPVVAISTYRPPEIVAASLEKRDGIPLRIGVALWEAYQICLLQQSAEVPTFVVSYDQLLLDPEAQARRLGRILEKAAPNRVDGLETDQVSRSIHVGLDRSRRPRPFEDWPRVRELASLLESAASRDEPVVEPDLLISRWSRDLLESWEQGKEERGRLRSEVRRLEKMARQARGELRVLRESSSDDDNAGAHELARSRVEVEELSGRIRALEAQLESERAERAADLRRGPEEPG